IILTASLYFFTLGNHLKLYKNDGNHLLMLPPAVTLNKICGINTPFLFCSSIESHKSQSCNRFMLVSNPGKSILRISEAVWIYGINLSLASSNGQRLNVLKPNLNWL